MKTSAGYFVGVLVSVFMLAGVVASPAMAQGEARAEGLKSTAKRLFRNDKVLVTEVTYKPGAEGKARKRPFRVLRALTSGTLQRIYANGRTENVVWEAGQVRVFEKDKEPFGTKNVGTSDLVLFLVVPIQPKK